MQYLQNKLNPGKLCKKCFTQRQANNNSTNNDNINNPNDSNNDYDNQDVINEKQINNDAFANNKTSEENVNINHYYPC